MAVYKIADDLDDLSFTLIAIHSILEDYRLAYFLNRELNLGLERLRENIKKDNQASFSHFEWYDVSIDTYWNLINNKGYKVVQPKSSQGMLAFNESNIKVSLLETHKQADFLLKIDNEEVYNHTEDVLQKIKNIPQVITCYEINTDQLKHKDQLNFLTNA